MISKTGFVLAMVILQLTCISKAYAGNCGFKTLECDEGAVDANEFMPSYGTIIAYDTDQNKRYVYNAFYWSSYDVHSWYHKNPYYTLEPDILFTGVNPYTTNFDPPFEWESGAFNPSTTTIISSGNMPCPYADAVLGDDVPTITVGSACANNFSTGENYFTYAKVNKHADTGYMWARYQRGIWGLNPVRTYVPFPVCIENLEPVWEIAPACIYSCCTEFPNQENNIEVIYANSPIQVPGCVDWNWVNGSSVPTRCKENRCSDEQDNDKDGLTDCDDPDCANSPDCTTLIDPPIDPCASVTSGNGYYCGLNEELTNYPGNDNDLVYCQDGMTVSVEYCENGCQPNLPGVDDECIVPGCTPICSAGQTRCSGNNVEVCSQDQCSYEFDYSCTSNQTCVNGSCTTQTAPAPVITSVSCTSYSRGDSATCTVYGNNFVAGGNTFIGDLENRQILSVTSTQVAITGYWDCSNHIGSKQVSHRNPDNQRDDTYDLVATVMGELQITSVWQSTVHEGATNVPMGANGCNFGPDVVFWAGGIQISNTHLQAEDQVLATGAVVGNVSDSPVDVCVAKYAGASIGFDKKCWYGYINIVP